MPLFSRRDPDRKAFTSQHPPLPDIESEISTDIPVNPVRRPQPDPSLRQEPGRLTLGEMLWRLEAFLEENPGAEIRPVGVRAISGRGAHNDAIAYDIAVDVTPATAPKTSTTTRGVGLRIGRA